MDPPPPGYRRDRWVRQLDGDDAVFERAVDALRTWRMHRNAGLIVETGGPPTVGEEVAMAAPLPIGYVDVVCRVVGVIDEPDRYGSPNIRTRPCVGEALHEKAPRRRRHRPTAFTRLG